MGRKIRQKTERRRRFQTNGMVLSGFVYNIVIAIVALIGLTAYMRGVSVEDCLLRSLLALLVCVVIGCVADLAVWVARAKTEPAILEPDLASSPSAWPAREIDGEARHIEASAPEEFTERKARQPETTAPERVAERSSRQLETAATAPAH
jgi:hypothetical protein